MSTLTILADSGWTPAAVTELITAITALVVAILGAYKSIVAHAAAQSAQATADANTVHGATLSDRVHELAVSAPAIVQDITPVLAAVEQVATDVKQIKASASRPAPPVDTHL